MNKKKAYIIIGLILILVAILIALVPTLPFSIAEVFIGEEGGWVTVKSGDTINITGYKLTFKFTFDEKPYVCYLDVCRKAKFKHTTYYYDRGSVTEYVERYVSLYGTYDYFYSKAPPNPLIRTIDFSKTNSWGGVAGFGEWELLEWLDEGMIALHYQPRSGSGRVFRLYVNLGVSPAEPPTESEPSPPPSPEQSDYPSLPEDEETGEPTIPPDSTETTELAEIKIPQPLEWLPWILTFIGIVFLYLGLRKQS